MPVNLSIKNVPDAIAAKLKERAARHHRSLQGELMAIIEEAIKEQPRLTLDEIWERENRLGVCRTFTRHVLPSQAKRAVW
jgi:antitoxin FitA